MIAAIIQARMGSTRLASKTLADLAGVPLLGRVIERTRAIPGVEAVVVATTTEPDDQAIADYAATLDVATFRGSTDDVLRRYADTARQVGATAVVRITADDPFKDPGVCGAVLADFLAGGADYVSNTMTLSYPEGLDVEVFSDEALQRADREANLASEREHVTPYIYNHPDRFRIRQVVHERDLSAHRWTLDYAEDLDFARAVYERMGDRGLFTMTDILTLLEGEPALREMNRGFTRNAGYLKSLALEQQS